MVPVIQHPWKVSIAEARNIQKQLYSQIKLEPIEPLPKTVVAVDVSYTRWDKMGYAVLGIFTAQADNDEDSIMLKEELIETFSGHVDFPYVPGFLSFREIPMLLPLFERINGEIDLIITDGVGIAHPRGLGLAAHLGLIFDIPSIGCAKSKLVGNYIEPGIEKGEYSDLYYKDHILGSVLRSKRRCRPLFVSPGYRCTIGDARKIILKFCTKYRICEPIRRVDAMSKILRKSNRS